MKYTSFGPTIKSELPESYSDQYYIYREGSILVKNNMGIPTYKDLEGLENILRNRQCMGNDGEKNCFSIEALEDIDLENVSFVNLMDYALKVSEEEYLMASRGRLLLDWLNRNKYCGNCGREMSIKDSSCERAMVCNCCGYTTWPRTSPAILVAIEKDGKILLASNRYYKEGYYSVLAGFVDYGESFEDCVKREVYEEVGLEIENINYFGSKPWPFPNSMMVAFKADYKSGEIKIDERELVDAAWFSPEDMPKLFKNPNSIACDLIRDYLNTYEK